MVIQYGKLLIKKLKNMKTYIILSLLLLSTLKTYAQLTIIPLEDELSLMNYLKTI